MLYRLTLAPNAALRKRFSTLVYDWDNCTRCSLHERRQKVVHVRGRMPCTVLLIGEAPGSNEDREGFPFVGRAGKLLEEKIIPDIQTRIGRKFTYAIINVLGCAPFRTVQSQGDLHPTYQIGTPTPGEILTCRPHTDSLISMSSPRACLLLGQTANKVIGPYIVGRDLQPVPTCHVYHPAYLIRQGDGGSLPPTARDPSLAYQKLVLTAAEYLTTQLRIS